ncbi:DsbA family protein [Ponticaulis sp.]|uniref:DsbA family protein n=1 Tax=Ponticaulis sp. TaxID=2020902 RepID=UPI000C5775D5|nr:DsbA family protein [Ponticaulis sp.]MAJ10288.1 disulfide bond formation protein DsbA [Ponticaulis sp.]HBH89077.1 disulfide bond formation protein DsbA [Hyphomonadaceae bacterium]|tara:strand:+ start:7294 stop:7941 length:648 start_codon:yes stop_codon:yes gene_type:complete
MSGVDIYWSFRSPYSYLATPRLREMSKRWDVPFTIKPVYPIAVRIPGFFKQVNPLWPPYLMRDCFRIAQFNGLPFGRPNPDPVVMDMATGDVPADQPYIHRLTRLGVLASHTPQALDYFYEVSTLIWSGETNWMEGSVLSDAVARAGLDLAALDADAIEREAELEAEIEANEAAQKNAGHWGVPLMVFEDEPFFGQDRLDILEWRMKQSGVPQTS